MDISKPAQKMLDQAKQLGYFCMLRLIRITFSDEEIKRDLLKMKKNNLEEARELIRKSLGLSKLPKKQEESELVPANKQQQNKNKASEEDKAMFGNIGVRRANNGSEIEDISATEFSAGKNIQSANIDNNPSSNVNQQRGGNEEANKHFSFKQYATYGALITFFIAFLFALSLAFYHFT